MVGCQYDKIDDQGLHITTTKKDKQGNVVEQNSQILPVDHVVICAGQTSRKDLFNELLHFSNGLVLS